MTRENETGWGYLQWEVTPLGLSGSREGVITRIPKKTRDSGKGLWHIEGPQRKRARKQISDLISSYPQMF